MSPENERFLRELVEHNRFPDFEAALDAVVRFYRQEYKAAVEDLRGKVQEGLDSLDRDGGKPLDMQKLKEQLRREFGERRAAHAAG